MISLLRITLSISVAGAAFAQVPGLTLPPSGNNQKASVTQFIGPVRVTIDYSSPAVKERRGQIWGKLVPYGLTNLGFGNGKPGPWRAGANENTVFAVSNDVLIEGKPLHAGRYGLHMIAGPDEWTLVFNKNAGAWGSFFYEDSEDALRVQVKPHKHDFQEYLTYEFTARHPSDATVELQWEELAVPWTIKVDNIEDIYVSRLQHELTTVPGFDYRNYAAAARYCAQTGKHLDQGLKWADAAIGMPNIGEKNFDTLSTKALVLVKMGQGGEAKTLMDTALHLPQTTPIQIHQYGRQLITMKRSQEALEVFKYNAERNGDNWPVHVGLARGYAAVGDNQKALEHAKIALTQAPDDLNKQGLAAMVKTLEEGKSIAQ